MHTITETTLEEVIADLPANVTAGMGWLDRVMPGWETKVDLDTLNIDSCKDCVLGQLLGNYFGSSDLHEEAHSYDQEFGFCTYSEEYLAKNDIFDTDSIMEQLTLTWKRMIEERR
tara:strand:+ start:1592 stop:1936 length:345 start_codon:yes stop_codon:yes gene_type:complete